MKRIYDSDALRREEDEPHTPSPREERRQDYGPQPMLNLPTGTLSDLFMPETLRRRSIRIDVSTPDNEYAVGSSIPFRVTMKNVLPVPVSIPTQSPLLWNWDVDGHEEGSQVPVCDPPDQQDSFGFERGERKVFRKRWNGMIRVSETEWEDPSAGTHTIGAGINVEDPEAAGVYGETTIELVPE